MTEIPSIAKKIATLRATFESHQIDGYLVPHGDEYQNEFVPEYSQRLKYLTGFTGSAGFSIVLNDKAVVMSDGRYSVQLKTEIDHSIFLIGDSTKLSVADWLKQNINEPVVIGYDPWLYSELFIISLQKSLANTNIRLKSIDKNLVDILWTNRPTPQWQSIEQFPIEYAGLSYNDKLNIIADIIQQHQQNSVLLTLPDSVSWCLNIRANDVPHNPIVLSRLLINANGTAILFLDDGRNAPELNSYFDDTVSVQPISKLKHYLEQHKNIMIDPQRSASAFFSMMRENGCSITEAKDPTIALKAKKNDAEIESMRVAHRRDAAAIIKFLAWLDANKTKSHTEITLDKQLEAFRRQSNEYRDSSFDTICGWNEHGAIIHYRAKPETAATIPQNANGILLLDSGGQYLDGTTDITRTLSFGSVDPEIRKQNTLVLKGMIAVSMAKFPYGTTGAQIDVLARKALWDHGLDYPHGTGHGVGCYLSVHEEATSLSPRSFDKLESGMIISNEPGYYKEGSHGIRIENLILCRDTSHKDELDRAIFEFETLTLVPFDRSLIDQSLLSPSEISWINKYHARILHEIGTSLNGDDLNWLKDACKAL
jgi:Xaa-Pro aminopeptidase